MSNSPIIFRLNHLGYFGFHLHNKVPSLALDIFYSFGSHHPLKCASKCNFTTFPKGNNYSMVYSKTVKADTKDSTQLHLPDFMSVYINLICDIVNYSLWRDRTRHSTITIIIIQCSSFNRYNAVFKTMCMVSVKSL